MIVVSLILHKLNILRQQRAVFNLHLKRIFINSVNKRLLRTVPLYFQVTNCK